MLADLLVCLSFNLSNTFASDPEFFSHFFEGMRNAVEQPMPHLENLPLFRRKVI